MGVRTVLRLPEGLRGAGRSHQAVVAGTVRPEPPAKYGSDKSRGYAHWAVAAFQGNSAAPQLFASGDCPPP